MDVTSSSSGPSDSSKPSVKPRKSATYRPPGSSFLKFLRGWIAFVGLMAFANTVQCFIKPDFVWEKLYNAPGVLTDGSPATLLTARTYGMWTLLAAVVRFMYAANIYNWELFLVTVATFLIAFGHFLTEMVYFHSGLADVGMYSPIIVSAVSVVLMLLSVPYIWPANSDEEDIDLRNFPKVKKSAKRQA